MNVRTKSIFQISECPCEKGDSDTTSVYPLCLSIKQVYHHAECFLCREIR